MNLITVMNLSVVADKDGDGDASEVTTPNVPADTVDNSTIMIMIFSDH